MNKEVSIDYLISKHCNPGTKTFLLPRIIEMYLKNGYSIVYPMEVTPADMEVLRGDDK